LKRVRQKFEKMKKKVFVISAATGEGVESLIKKLAEKVNK